MMSLIPIIPQRETPSCSVDNISLYVDVIKKTELSKNDILIVKIKSNAMGINSTLLGQVMDKHFPENEVLIIDDTVDIEVIKGKE